MIQYRELLKELSQGERKLLMRDVDKFATKYPEYGHMVQIRKDIYKLDRLEGLQYSIQMQQVEMGIKEIEDVEKHLEKIYGKNYRLMAESMGLGSDFLSIDKDAAKILANKKWFQEKNFSDRIWNNKEKLIQYLISDFKNGIIRGDNYQKLVKQMRERFKNRSKADIERLVRTEGTYINNQAMMAPFLESDLHDKYKYVAMMDSKTSDICRSLDGQEFDLDKQQPGINFPPMHPNCRSTFEIVIPDDYIDRYVEKYSQEMRKSEETLENKPNTSYNNTKEKYAGKQALSFVNKETIRKIEENNNWSSDFKARLIQRVRYFNRHGIDTDIHFVPKVDRLNKKGYIEITDDDIINTFKQPAKFIDQNGAKIHFSKELQLAVLEDKNSGKLFGTIRRKDISDRWKEV